jgi:hypothetical protein
MATCGKPIEPALPIAEAKVRLIHFEMQKQSNQ